MNINQDEELEKESSIAQQLVSADQEHPIEKLLAFYKSGGHGRLQYLIGSYFKSRTFHFAYSFSRNEFKWGKEYFRALIQPLNMGSFLMIPWVLLNFVDSFVFRIVYDGYCEECGWKYCRLTHPNGHTPEECGYNREYTAIVRDILSGKISKTEGEFKQFAYQKTKLGKKSAYHDLCTGKDVMSGFLDVVCIWFSISLMLLLLICLSLPYLFSLLHESSGLGL